MTESAGWYSPHMSDMVWSELYRQMIPSALQGRDDLTWNGHEWVAPEGADFDGDDDAFDPGDYKVAEVVHWVAAHPDQRERVLAAEQDGKNRSSLVEALSAE